MGAKVSISDNLDVDKILKNSSKNVQILCTENSKIPSKGGKGKMTQRDRQSWINNLANSVGGVIPPTLLKYRFLS